MPVLRRVLRIGTVVGVVAVACSLASAAGAATITVDVTGDEINADADCSLREAVQSANTNSANTTGCVDGDAGVSSLDTIALVPGASYSRSIPPDATPDDNQDGDIDLLTAQGGPVLIEGASAESEPRATISGGSFDRVLHQVNSNPLTLRGITITDGFLDDPIAQGAGVLSFSTLTIEDSAIFDNHNQQADGGGIWAASLTMTDSIVVENSAAEDGGGIAGGPLTIDGSTIAENDAGPAPAARGGGITTNANDLTITDSVFDANSVSGANGSGGALSIQVSSSGTKMISGSTFTGNDADYAGGAINVSLNSPTAPVDIETTRIEDSEAGRFGGGIRVAGGDLDLGASILRDNHALSATDPVEGGGLDLSDDASADVTDTVVRENTAETTGSAFAQGGGVDVAGSLTMERSSVLGNMVNSTGGSQQRGGGINIRSVSGPSAVLVNTTVGGNSAVDAGALGGGIAVTSGFLGLVHSSLNFNAAGGANDEGDALSEEQSSTVLVKTSAFGDPSLPSEDLCASDGGSGIQSNGFNVASGASCGFTGEGDQQGVDPLLSAAADNSGLRAGPPGATLPVETMRLLPGSPAINHVPEAECLGGDGTPLQTDARGFPRPAGPACETGAYEVTNCFGTEIVADALVGTEGDDVLKGTSGADVIFALAGVDKLKGKGGRDRLCGVAGKDAVSGGKGKDRLNGGADKDVCNGGKGKDKAVDCEKKKSVP